MCSAQNNSRVKSSNGGNTWLSASISGSRLHNGRQPNKDFLGAATVFTRCAAL